MIIKKATIKDFEKLKDIKLESKKDEMNYSDSLKPLSKTIDIYFEFESILITPFTSNNAPGLAVPIPTNPEPS